MTTAQRQAPKQGSNLMGFFSSETKAFATFKVKDENTKVGFSPDSKALIVVSVQGKFYEVAITSAGGELQNPIEKTILENKPIIQGQAGQQM